MVARVSWGLAGLMKRAERVLGPWELITPGSAPGAPAYCNCSEVRGNSLTLTVEDLKPVDLKLFREIFPSLYSKEKRFDPQDCRDRHRRETLREPGETGFQHNCAPHKGAQARHEGLVWLPRGLSDYGDSLRGGAQEGKSKNLALAYHAETPENKGIYRWR